ncbi:MAG: hypothetical protein ACJAYG_000288 [Oceanicoccus sp.]|jgi:hypothetical protein
MIAAKGGMFMAYYGEFAEVVAICGNYAAKCIHCVAK